MSTDNKRLDKLVGFLLGESPYMQLWFGNYPDGMYQYWWRSDLRKLYEELKDQRTKDLKKLSYHFAIPVEDLEKALAAKDEPLANKEIK